MAVHCPRLTLLILVLATLCSNVYCKYCYVGTQNARVYDTSQEAIECSAAIYGENAACAIACARHKKDKTDVCSFLCIPGQHCNDANVVHPISEVSPGLFLPGCPRQKNFEAVGGGEYDCVTRCCMNDRCNTNVAAHIHRALLTAVSISGGVLVVLLLISI